MVLAMQTWNPWKWMKKIYIRRWKKYNNICKLQVRTSIFFRLCICCTLLCRFSNCKLVVQSKEGLQRLTQLGYSNYKCTCRWDMTGKLFLFIYYNVYLSYILNSGLIMSQKKHLIKSPKTSGRGKTDLRFYS